VPGRFRHSEKDRKCLKNRGYFCSGRFFVKFAEARAALIWRTAANTSSRRVGCMTTVAGNRASFEFTDAASV
jgi:hypothetical protein